MTEKEFQKVCDRLSIKTTYDHRNKVILCRYAKVDEIPIKEIKNVKTLVGVKRILTKHQIKYYDYIK